MDRGPRVLQSTEDLLDIPRVDQCHGDKDGPLVFLDESYSQVRDLPSPQPQILVVALRFLPDFDTCLTRTGCGRLTGACPTTRWAGSTASREKPPRASCSGKASPPCTRSPPILAGATVSGLCPRSASPSSPTRTGARLLPGGTHRRLRRPAGRLEPRRGPDRRTVRIVGRRGSAAGEAEGQFWFTGQTAAGSQWSGHASR